MVDIHAIAKQLDILSEDLIAKVPEHLFIQHLLPIIAWDEGHTDLEVWNHLAGSIFNRIAVVAPSGETLFVLPAIASSPVTPSDRESSSALFEIMNGYELRTKLSPVYAKSYFEQAVDGKIVSKPRNFEQIKALDEILVRYGREPHIPKGYNPSSPTASSSTGEGSADEEELEDM